jgi:hypothetical protein
MGELQGILQLTTSNEMSDRAILDVINPPAADRVRSHLLEETYSLESAYTEHSKMVRA